MTRSEMPHNSSQSNAIAARCSFYNIGYQGNTSDALNFYMPRVPEQDSYYSYQKVFFTNMKKSSRFLSALETNESDFTVQFFVPISSEMKVIYMRKMPSLRPIRLSTTYTFKCESSPESLFRRRSYLLIEDNWLYWEDWPVLAVEAYTPIYMHAISTCLLYTSDAADE